MGILDRLFRKPHPSDNWIASPYFPLVLDLTEHALCNVGIGQPVEYLSVLGPPEGRREVHGGRYCWFSKGIEVDADERGMVDGIVVIRQDYLREGFSPFTGRAVHRGRSMELGAYCTEASFIEIFGEPFHRDADNDEIILFYEHRADVEWQVEFSKNGLLRALIITAHPLLEDCSQREEYGVTRPWPPDYR